MAAARTRPLSEPDEASIAPRLPSREQEEAPAPSALADPHLPSPASLAGPTRGGGGGARPRDLEYSPKGEEKERAKKRGPPPPPAMQVHNIHDAGSARM